MTSGPSVAAPVASRRTGSSLGPALRWSGRGLALLALVVLQANWFALDVPVPLKIFQGLLLALACWRPDSALLVLAGLGPLATSIAELTGANVPGNAFFEQMALAVLTGAVIRWPRPGRLRLGAPAVALGAVIVASAAGALPSRLLANDPGQTIASYLLGLWQGDYAARVAPWRPLFLATMTLEGLGLACLIEAVARREPAVLRRVLGLSLMALAGVAVLNVYRLAAASLAGATFPASLPALLAKLRVSTQYDANAAGSTFALIALAGLALLRRPAWRAAIVAAGVALTMLGLWMTGSRTALAAVVVVATAMLVVTAVRRGGLARRAALAAVVALLVATAVVAIWYPRGRNHFSVARAVESRRILADVALRATASAPALGIGFGTFFERSTDFGSAQLLKIGWARPHENAHDYFLQILAECGLIGLAAFLLVPAAAIVPALRESWRRPRIVQLALTSGVVAFMLTWLTGHPMLISGAAFAFWMFVGLLAATTAEASARRPAVTWALAASVVVLLASVPFRAVAARDALDLEYRGIGVSLWQSGPEGVRARSAGTSFSLFLPVDARIALPVRLASPVDGRVDLDVRFEGRLMNAVPVSGAEWRTVTLQFPSRGRRYERIDFSLTSPDGAPVPSVWIGKDDDRPIR